MNIPVSSSGPAYSQHFVRVGTTATFVWEDNNAHQVRSTGGVPPVFDSGEITQNGHRFEITCEVLGIVQYQDVNTGHRGTLMVVS